MSTTENTNKTDIAQKMESLSVDEKKTWHDITEEEEKDQRDEVDIKELEELRNQQMDPNSPLHSSVDSFEKLDLKPEILKAVHKLGWDIPSKIQGRSIPILLKSRKNLIAQSQSGTGKTGCFILGMLHVVNEKFENPQAICICPTLELATQIYNVCTKLAEFSNIKVKLVLKGHESRQKIKEHIVIGTPGKMFDLIKRRSIDTKYIKMYVLDEADQMLDATNKALRDQSIQIKKKLPRTCRIVLFSATFQDGVNDAVGAREDAKILEFAKRIVPPPLELILVPREQLSLKGIRQYFIITQSEDEKYQTLKYINDSLVISQAVIFVNTKDKANRLTEQLRKDGYTVSILHGDMAPDDRKKIITDFKNANTKVLITTNVLARGLDISQVSHVINYEMPLTIKKQVDPSTYLHRIGRSGRFGKQGIAINLISQDERKMISQLEEFFKITMKEVERDPEAIEMNIK